MTSAPLSHPDRPYYAGITIGRRTQGSAGTWTYEFSYFVLIEDVKERATFTPSDTFNIASYIITDASIRNLRGKIPDPVLLQLDAIKDPARKYKSPKFEHLLMTTLKIADIRVVATINEFARKEATEWKKIASYDRLERIVRWFSDQQLRAIAEIARDPLNINQPVADYVEAQIHGPINFSDDIQEMRIADWEIEGNATCLLNMKKFAGKHGLPIKMFSLGDI